jgi:hypothetical protein
LERLAAIPKEFCSIFGTFLHPLCSPHPSPSALSAMRACRNWEHALLTGGFAMFLKTAQETIARRTLLARGGCALAGLALLDSTFAKAFAVQPGEEVIPWADQPPPVPLQRLTPYITCSAGRT